MGEQGPSSYGIESSWEKKGMGCGQWTEEGERDSKFDPAYQIIVKIDLPRWEDGIYSRQLGSLIHTV